MKSIYKTTLLYLILAMVVLSCDKMEDIHAGYLEDGEIIYANVPDTLQTMPGRNSVQMVCE